MTSRRPVVGITGLPCAGKSEAARLMAGGEVTGRPGELVRADDLGHAALERPEVREALRRRFGDGVTRGGDGREVRRRVAERVFSDPGELAWLEGVLHPIVLGEAKRIADAAGGRRLVAVEAALLFAAGMEGMCDAVVLIEAARETRLWRAAARGWDERELERRERRQLPLFGEARLAALGDKLIRVRNDSDDGALAGRLRAGMGAFRLEHDRHRHDETARHEPGRRERKSHDRSA